LCIGVSAGIAIACICHCKKRNQRAAEQSAAAVASPPQAGQVTVQMQSMAASPRASAGGNQVWTTSPMGQVLQAQVVHSHPEASRVKRSSSHSGIEIGSPASLGWLLVANTYHFFLSHSQGETGPQVQLIANKLRDNEFETWYDKFDLDVTARGMLTGVQRSAIFVLVLSEGVFTRPFCRFEILAAVKAGKPFITLVEKDGRRNPFNFADTTYKGVPASFHPLIDAIKHSINAIEIRTQDMEHDVMVKRLVNIAAAGKGQIFSCTPNVIASIEADPGCLPALPANWERQAQP
tara:strand:- start:360 stop:1235 length:876 start_codon:yes stop_codon:yes gene_type:complete